MLEKETNSRDEVETARDICQDAIALASARTSSSRPHFPTSSPLRFLYCSATHPHTRDCLRYHPPEAARTMLGLRGIRTASPTLLRSSREIGARRWASGESGFTGAADNAFNRERQAVKDHAGATAGTSRSPQHSNQPSSTTARMPDCKYRANGTDVHINRSLAKTLHLRLYPGSAYRRRERLAVMGRALGAQEARSTG